MGRVADISRALKQHDSCLYAQETKPGRIDVYRKSQFGGHPPNLVFSLTENWLVTGRPVPWGIDVVLNRLKAHDLWRDDRFVERLIEDQEKEEESKTRDFRNNVESFLYDFRRQFQKATNDINTSTLNKDFPERKRHYGHC